MKAFLKISLTLGLGTIVALLMAFHFRIPVSETIGDFLLLPSSDEKSDVIFVMGGDPIGRLPLGLKLHIADKGDSVWFPTTAVSQEDRKFKKDYGFAPGEEFIVKKVLRESSLLPQQYKVLPGSTSTYTDLVMLRDKLKGSTVKSVTIVSMPYHFKRIKFCTDLIFEKDSDIAFRYQYKDPTEWRGNLLEEDDFVMIVVSEYLKHVAYRCKYLL
ncbi:MAG: hypothetical protein JKX97_02785 [Candidatus Lindowbacteria bacterium]|nr:hypothetical protein [Candidatus Lindowbacteria bacterium]